MKWTQYAVLAALAGTHVGVSSGIAAEISDEKLQQLLKRLDELEQRVKIQDRNYELDKEDAATKAKTTPLVSVGAGGFSMTSADKAFTLKFKGLVQTDSRNYFDGFDGAGKLTDDSFLIRRARPGFEGTFYNNFDFQFITEFGGTGAPSILDANINYRYSPEFQLKIGKFKAPVGLEQLQSDPVRFFAENALPTNLVPNRDLGVQLHGEIKDGLIQYQLGVFNGLADGASSNNADFDDDKDVVGRIFVHPFLLKGPELLQGLGLGVSASYGARGDNTAANASTITGGLRSDGQRTFFAYRGTVTGIGSQHRVSPQFYYYYDRLGLLGEYVVSSQQLRNTTGGRTDSLYNSSWQVTASYLLTDDVATFKGVTPKKNFDPANNSWGAFQLVARIAQLDVDDDAFLGGANSFAAPTTAATGATSWGVGLNWYLNRNVRASVSYSTTHFDVTRGFRPAAGSVIAQDEQFLVSRVQLSF